MKEIRQRVEKELTDGAAKATLGDYIKLVQLEKDLKKTQPKEMTVTWVESSEK